jgi:ribosomal protein S18 acetylase RimI-like enzyme
MKGIDLGGAGLGDALDIAALQTESWRSTYRGLLPDSYLDGPIVADRERHWRKMLSEDARHRIFLAKDNGDVAGFVCVLLDEEPAWGARLDNIHVKPALKGQGIGRVLFRQAA